MFNGVLIPILLMDERIEMKKPIRVGIVDDHAGVRVAIRDLLADEKDILVVGEGENGAEAIQLADQLKPDVLLLDVELPVIRGDEAILQIRETSPEVKVLALSSYDDPMYIHGMVENGAAGYIMKDEASKFLLVAIRSIMRDKVKWISPNLANQVSQIMLENKVFTGHELSILRYIVLDKTDDEIASAMEIDEKLLNRYIALLMEKFNVSTRENLKSAAQDVISTSNS